MGRNKIIDISKGIGILLVIFAHVLIDSNVTRAIYIFHMPLFFFLNGMSLFYSLKKEIKFREYFVKKFNSILRPYFIFLILSFIYWVLIERKIRGQFDISIVDNFINIFVGIVNMDLYSSNVVMWFLPCLFITDIIFYFIIKRKKYIFISILFSLIGILLIYNKIYLPFGIETAFISMWVVMLGYIFEIKNIKINKIYYLFFSLLCFVLVFLAKHSLNMLGHDYGNYILYILGASSGIVCILFISNIFNKNIVINNLFSFLGINSLLLMVTHEPIKRIICKFLNILVNIEIDILRTNIIYSILITIIIILSIIPFTIIINKKIPFIVGKKR